MHNSKNTSASFESPSPENQAEISDATEESIEKPAQGKVLIVDDEEGICRTVKRLLESGDRNSLTIRCDCVNSVESAIRKIEEGFSPDIIFSDMSMPFMTGKDFYEWLKKEKPDLAEKIYFMTGGVSDKELKEFVEKMEKQGRLIEKPDIIRIREVVEDFLCPN